MISFYFYPEMNLKLPTKKQMKMNENRFIIDLDKHIETINKLRECKENRFTSNKLITNLFRRIANRQCKDWRKINVRDNFVCPICKQPFNANERLDCDHGDYTFDLINDYLNAYYKIPFNKDSFTDDEVLKYSIVFDKIHNALVTNNVNGWTYMHPKCHKLDDHDDCKQHGGGRLLTDSNGNVYYQGKNEVVKMILGMKNGEE